MATHVNISSSSVNSLSNHHVINPPSRSHCITLNHSSPLQINSNSNSTPYFECTVADRRRRLKMNPAAVEAPFIVLFLLAAALPWPPLAGARLLVEMTVVRDASSIGACKWERFGSFFFPLLLCLWFGIWSDLVLLLDLDKFVWTEACRRTTWTEDSAPEREIGFYSSRWIISLLFTLILLFCLIYIFENYN